MSKYKSGSYVLIGFDRVGTKLFMRPATVQNFTGSIAEGEQAVASEECSSFVVIRVMYNSMARENRRWEI